MGITTDACHPDDEGKMEPTAQGVSVRLNDGKARMGRKENLRRHIPLSA